VTFEIGLMLFLVALAFAAFVREVFPIEVTALGLLGILLAAGLVTPEQAFSGFSNKAVIAIGALFMLSRALTKTGMLEWLASTLESRVGERSWLGIGLLLALVAVLSGFLNNTAVVAIFIPLAIQLCGRFGVSPSRVLIPLSYAAIFGGTLTLIGTSTNLLVGSIVEESGMAPLRMFEFSKLGVVFLAIGLAYILLFARRLLPERVKADTLTGKYRMGPYLTEVRVPKDSELVGRTCRQARLNQTYRVTVLAIVRGKNRHIQQAGSLPLAAGDLLIVQGTVEDLLDLRNKEGLELLPDVKLSDEDLRSGGLEMAEGLVSPTSALIGQTLAQVDFRGRFGGFVLAVRRVGVTLRKRISKVRFQFADSLLILIPRSKLEDLRRSDDVMIVSELSSHLWRGRFWWLVLILVPVAVALAAFNLLQIAAGAGLAVIVLLMLKVLTPQEGYRSVDWSVIFMIAAFVPVGQAFVTTGTAEFLASWVLRAGAVFPPELASHALLSLVYVVTSLLTQMVSNNAAAIILTPIAISIATSMGLDPRPFVMAVCFAASAEFMTPMGYQTNLMVYGPGAYRFLDYTRFGAPLNLVFWILATLLIPKIWPF